MSDYARSRIPIRPDTDNFMDDLIIGYMTKFFTSLDHQFLV